MRFLVVLFCSACASPHLVLRQGPLERVEQPPQPKPAMSTDDEFPDDWCPSDACDPDDDTFRAKAQDKKGADPK